MKTQKLIVGMTYDLKTDYLEMGYSAEEASEFDTIDTVEAIEHALLELGFRVDRIGHVKALVDRLARGERWDIVFNFYEGTHGLACEAQVPCLLDAYDIPYVFSDASILALALDKGLTKQVLRERGVPTAPFTVARSMTELKQLPGKFPLFVKPLAEGSSKGIHADSLVKNLKELRKTSQKLFKKGLGPLLVETFLPGEEFTVGIGGTGNAARVLGVMSIKRKDGGKLIYSYEAKQNYLELLDYKLVKGALARKTGKVALEAWRAIGGRDVGRVDLRLDAAGVPNFIEVNTLPGLNPTNSDLIWLTRFAGISYRELISRIMKSALSRIKKTRPKNPYFEPKTPKNHKPLPARRLDG